MASSEMIDENGSRQTVAVVKLRDCLDLSGVTHVKLSLTHESKGVYLLGFVACTPGSGSGSGS